MTPSGQRAVPVKKRPSLIPFRARTLAATACLLVSLPGVARGQDGGLPDAPLARRLDCGLCLNEPAEKALDNELKRLQGVERQHKEESWVKVVLVSGAVGVVAGIALGVALGYAIPRK